MGRDGRQLPRFFLGHKSPSDGGGGDGSLGDVDRKDERYELWPSKSESIHSRPGTLPSRSSTPLDMSSRLVLSTVVTGVIPCTGRWESVSTVEGDGREEKEEEEEDTLHQSP